ncbi:MAG: glycosyl transferase, partial [Nitrososphaeraceae archaeon]
MNLELLLTLVVLVMLVTMMGIFVTWSYFLVYMLKSFRESPKLQQFIESSTRAYAKISVIV